MSNIDVKKIERFRKYIRRFEGSVEYQMKQNNCCSGITLKQCHTLLALEDLKTSSLSDLANKLYIDKSSASRSIENLHQLGLVKRETNPENRRETILTLTHKGISLVNNINKDNNEFYQNILEKIPKEKIETIIESLDILSDAIYKRI